MKVTLLGERLLLLKGTVPTERVLVEALSCRGSRGHVARLDPIPSGDQLAAHPRVKVGFREVLHRGVIDIKQVRILQVQLLEELGELVRRICKSLLTVVSNILLHDDGSFLPHVTHLANVEWRCPFTLWGLR